MGGWYIRKGGSRVGITRLAAELNPTLYVSNQSALQQLIGIKRRMLPAVLTGNGFVVLKNGFPDALNLAPREMSLDLLAEAPFLRPNRGQTGLTWACSVS